MLAMSLAGLTWAQKGQGNFGGGGFGIPQLPGAQQVTFEASFELEKGTKNGRVHITAEIEDGWHVYSVTQPPGGPLVTEITVEADAVELTGPFAADAAPEIHEEDIYPGVPIEEHYGQVTWSAPFQLKKEIEPESTTLSVSARGQVCITDGSCVQFSDTVEAKFSDYYGGETFVESLRVEGSHAVWKASLDPANAQPGGSAVLQIRAITDNGYHVYRYVGDDETKYRTLIAATKKAGLKFGAPTTAAEIESVDAAGTIAEYYVGPVEWTIPITIPESAGIGEHPLEVQVGFFTCNDRSCDLPKGVKITGSLNVGGGQASKVALGISEVSFQSVADLPNLTTWIDNQPKVETQTFSERFAGNGLSLWMVFAAIAGGFILNFMPCVLPVIGLKLMSFVSQSGNSHTRVVALNVSYVLGILAVLLFLALLNVGAKMAGSAFGWGQQFTHIQFVVPMAVLLFAMSLSFLGVWEIPIPGFATSSKSGELMEKEGLLGAFLKGILTTVLATPCSGPFLGTLFGLTLTLSVPSIILLYMLVGIGLGLPYIALCFSPGFIKLMPKPGAWMDTLKQVLAFPLLLTVVYFVQLVNPDYRIATLILLIVVWFACWLIGRVPAYAEKRRLRAAWATAALTTALGAVIGFGFFGPIKHNLDWIPYSEATLAQHRNDGKTVMIEFTARWCPTCQVNMKLAIDRPQVAELVERNDVVPLLADWSEPSPEIHRKVQELDALSIPLLAIYPADPDAEPIILRDSITESQLLEALEQAGPSQSDAASPAERSAQLISY
ncbi:MAG: thioredoxin family protein [Pirellulaceae bacterium]